MSGRLTTASEPSESGCSGSEMVEMRSIMHCGQRGQARWVSDEWVRHVSMLHTVDFLLVYALDGTLIINIRIAGRQGLIERIAEIAVARDQAIEQARATVVSSLHGALAATGWQIGGVQNSRVSVVLVVHGGGVGSVVWGILPSRYGRGLDAVVLCVEVLVTVRLRAWASEVGGS